MKRSQHKAKFRLQAIRTHEVGLVDRPANLEPFLVVKGADGAALAPVAAAKDGVAPTAPVAAADPAAPPAAPPADAAPGDLGPMAAATKQSVIDTAGQVIESVQALAMAAGAAPTDDAAPTPPALVAGLSAIAGTLVDLCVQLDPSYVEMARKPKEPPAPPAPPPGPPAPPSDEMAKSLSSIADAIGALKTSLEKDRGEMKASVDALAVVVKATTIRKSIREIPAGNGQPPENAPVVQTTKAEVWPEDIAESARIRAEKREQERRANALGGGNGC